jgi:hypothetical protein
MLPATILWYPLSKIFSNTQPKVTGMFHVTIMGWAINSTCMLRENLNSITSLCMSRLPVVNWYSKWKRHELWTYNCIRHSPHRRPCTSSCSKCSPLRSVQWQSSCSVRMLNLLNHRQAWQRTRLHLSLRSRLGGLLSRLVETHGTLHHSIESASLWPHLCTRYFAPYHSRVHLYGHPCLCTWPYNSWAVHGLYHRL